jgi:hypothetical protein
VKPGDKAEQVRRLRHAPSSTGGAYSSRSPFHAQDNSNPIKEWLITCYQVLSGKHGNDASAPSSLRMTEALIPGANTLPPKRLVVSAKQGRVDFKTVYPIF